MDENRRVLITGAAGLIAEILRTHWKDRYQLRLADVLRGRDDGPYEEFVKIDVTEYDQMLQACEGMDTVVHLTADPRPSAEFYKTLLPLNIVGAYNAFHAAYETHCRRIVFASSGQAVLGYTGDVPIQ